ncbi:hypothetical protein Xekk_02943 [Xenorhabdus sp. KK7.4]|nr:hypothetical protein Xekk_02943 [Xenorhabdus sp. KK7.4]
MLRGLYVLFCSAFLPVVTIATLGILCALLELIGEDKAKNYSFKDWIDIGVIVIIALCLCYFFWSQLPELLEWWDEIYSI